MRTKAPQLHEHNRPILKVLDTMLTPKEAQAGQVTPASIQVSVREHPELYAEHPDAVARVLSLLEVESHIWASETSLEVCETQDDIVGKMVSEATEGVVKDAHEELDSPAELLQSFEARCRHNIVWEYNIKEDSMLSKVNNQKFHVQFKKAVQAY